MKFGVRKPSLKKSFKARTTGKLKRSMKKAVNPLYGKKGMGLINNPKKAVYNKIYNKTTVSLLNPPKKKRNTSSSAGSLRNTNSMKTQPAAPKKAASGRGCVTGIIVAILLICCIGFLPGLFVTLVGLAIVLAIRGIRGKNKADSPEPMIEQSTENVAEDPKALPQPNIFSEGIVPLDALLKASTPSGQGLYPHEILMLSYAGTYKVNDGNSFQQFWRYQYSVEDPQSVLDSLHSRGFLASGDLRSALERQKAADLKAELQAMGQKATGKKAELIDRLLNSGNTAELESKFSERFYTLTDTGVKELADNEYVVYLHRTKRMSVWDMNRLLHQDNPSHLGYRDILWRELNGQSDEHFQSGNMGLYRSTRLSMYQFLMEEDRIEPAFVLLCEVAAYDLSGMGNNEWRDPPKNMQKHLLAQTISHCFPYGKSIATLPPAVVGWMAEAKDKLGMTETAFREALLENFDRIPLLRRIFTNEECVEIVMNEIGKHTEKLTAIYDQAETRMKHELDSMK